MNSVLEFKLAAWLLNSVHGATSQPALCYVHLMCICPEKRTTNAIEDTAKSPQLLLRNTNFPLFFLKKIYMCVYILQLFHNLMQTKVNSFFSHLNAKVIFVYMRE